MALIQLENQQQSVEALVVSVQSPFAYIAIARLFELDDLHGPRMLESVL